MDNIALYRAQVATCLALCVLFAIISTTQFCIMRISHRRQGKTFLMLARRHIVSGLFVCPVFMSFSLAAAKLIQLAVGPGYRDWLLMRVIYETCVQSCIVCTITAWGMFATVLVEGVSIAQGRQPPSTHYRIAFWFVMGIVLILGPPVFIFSIIVRAATDRDIWQAVPMISITLVLLASIVLVWVFTIRLYVSAVSVEKAAGVHEKERTFSCCKLRNMFLTDAGCTVIVTICCVTNVGSVMGIIRDNGPFLKPATSWNEDLPFHVAILLGTVLIICYVWLPLHILWRPSQSTQSRTTATHISAKPLKGTPQPTPNPTQDNHRTHTGDKEERNRDRDRDRDRESHRENGDKKSTGSSRGSAGSAKGQGHGVAQESQPCREIARESLKERERLQEKERAALQQVGDSLTVNSIMFSTDTHPALTVQAHRADAAAPRQVNVNLYNSPSIDGQHMTVAVNHAHAQTPSPSVTQSTGLAGSKSHTRTPSQRGSKAMMAQFQPTPLPPLAASESSVTGAHTSDTNGACVKSASDVEMQSVSGEADKGGKTAGMIAAHGSDTHKDKELSDTDGEKVHSVQPTPAHAHPTPRLSPSPGQHMPSPSPSSINVVTI